MAVFQGSVPENDLTYKDFLEIKSKANQGEPFAMHKLGLFYMFGQFVDQDEDEALKWFAKAGNRGVADAQWGAGDIYRYGTDKMAPNPGLSARWFRLAVKTEPSGKNLRTYGECLETGFGVNKDIAEAVDYYERAVEEGDSVAFFRLGRLLLIGEGVPQDVLKGLSYIYTAKMRGIEEASNYWARLEASGMLKGIQISEKEVD